MSRSKLWLAALAALVIAAPALAQQTPPDSTQAGQPTMQPATPPPSGAPPITSTEPDYPRGRISGYLFGDAYYNVVGQEAHSYTGDADILPTNIDGKTYPPKVIGKDLNGFQIRRIYFQADNDLSAKYSTRFRLEADSKSVTTDGKISVAVKAAYLQAKNVLPGGNFFFGMLPTPIYENPEEFWGYRSLEKTIADFRGVANSADLGVEMKGFVDADHKLGYSAMIGDGTGQVPENNRYKRFYFALPLRPFEALHLEPYADYENQPGAAEKATYKLFAGWELKKVALGTELLDGRLHSTTGAVAEPVGISVYARTKQMHKVNLVGRFDRWQPNTRAANRIDSDLYIAGVDWEPYHDVHLIPNIEATNYHARGTAVAPPNHDLQARITFFYKWSKP